MVVFGDDESDDVSGDEAGGDGCSTERVGGVWAAIDEASEAVARSSMNTK